MWTAGRPTGQPRVTTPANWSDLVKRQLTDDPGSVELRDAATVMLVRDSAEGPEVFMLQRTHSASFARGHTASLHPARPGAMLRPA